MNEPLLSTKDVKQLTSLSKASIYRGIQAGTFPPPHKITPRKNAWQTSDIENWKRKVFGS
jgi:prophage regulatory protein